VIFFFQAEDGIRVDLVTGVQTCALPISILEEQRGRFMNPDRKARFEFVMPALSENQQTRDAWFESLKDVNHRRREPWVLEGLQRSEERRVRKEVRTRWAVDQSHNSRQRE